MSTFPRCSPSRAACARRFKATEGSHRYVALYHLAGPEVTASERWQTATNTPSTLKMRRHTSDRLRLVLRSYGGHSHDRDIRTHTGGA